MANANRVPVRFSDAPGGKNPLTDEDARHLRETLGRNAAKLFAAGYDTREIAQVLDRPEADVYNSRDYRGAI